MTAPRVELRPLKATDRDPLLVWRNSPQVAAYMYSDHPISPDEHARWFTGIAGDETRAYWIIEMDDSPVGLVNLYAVDPAAKACAWAYYLADPATRGRGVGAYVEFRMLDQVLRERGFETLWCEVLEDNEAIWKLHQSFGFEIVERLAGRAVKAGVARDALRLKITRQRWGEARAACAARLKERGFSL